MFIFQYSQKLIKGIFYLSLMSVSLGAQFAMAQSTNQADKAAIFAAAGFKNTNGSWRGKCSLGHIPVIKDINGDGRLDAIVRDGGTECYGTTGVGFYLITMQKDGKWTRIFNSPGEPQFLKTVGRHGWPEMVVTNPSQCHQVFSWDGSKFIKVRQEYKAKAC